MKTNKKNGLSLIIIIITIVVIIIMSTVVILSISGNNPIAQASNFEFKNDLTIFYNQLNAYNSNQLIDGVQGYTSSRLQADVNSVTYNGTEDTSKTINDIIPLLGDKPKYYGQFEVVDGKLVFLGTDINLKELAQEMGIGSGSVTVNKINVKITIASETLIAPGTDITYTVEFSSDAAISTIDLVNKMQVITNSGTVLPSQPAFVIGTIIGDESDLTRSVDVTIKTDTLSSGSYKLRIKSGSATNANDISNTKDTTSLEYFSIDSIAPKNPTIAANPTGWTNSNVIVTVTYSTDSSIKQYSTNGTIWNTYSTPITVSTNNTTVYAKSIDAVGNQSGQSTLTVANIDKTTPTLMFGTNGGSNSVASTTVTVSDTSGSNVNQSTLKYVWDTQNITTPITGWITFTNGQELTKARVTGTYYLWIKASDNAGNLLVAKSNAFIITLTYDVANAPVEESLPVTNTLIVNSTMDGQFPLYNNPVIPVGFGAVNTSAASWDNISTDWNLGLVIQDESGNQFVWVPVDGTNVPYAKWCVTGWHYDDTIVSDDTLPAGVTEANQIVSYGGFYIARYASMFDYNNGNIRVASKKSSNATTVNWSTIRESIFDKYLWNFIDYTDSKFYAEDMAVAYGYDTSKVITNLITGTEWDTVLKWVQNSGLSATDGRAWGNTSNSVSPANVTGFSLLQASGYSEYWKAKNIYDLCGNAWSWTNERYGAPNGIYRGGGYLSSGRTYPPAYRFMSATDSTLSFVAFRPVLYIF